MPRSPEDNQQIRDARRDAIMRAAERVFARKGYSATKVSDIASAAGLSHGLVYHYFDSKEGIFAALLDEMMDQIAADLEVDGETPLARLTAIIDNGLERLVECPECGQLVTQTILLGGLPESLRRRALEHARKLRERWIQIVRDCQKTGTMRADIEPVQLASAMLNMFRGMSIRPAGLSENPFLFPNRETILQLLSPAPEPPRAQATRRRKRHARKKND